MTGHLLLSMLCVLLGLLTLWPADVVEVLRDHTVIVLVAVVLIGVGAEAILTAIKTAEATRCREASAMGRPS